MGGGEVVKNLGEWEKASLTNERGHRSPPAKLALAEKLFHKLCGRTTRKMTPSQAL